MYLDYFAFDLVLFDLGFGYINVANDPWIRWDIVMLLILWFYKCALHMIFTLIFDLEHLYIIWVSIF